MNWYSVGGAAAAGALAALIATVVASRRAESKAAYVVVFALAFGVLNFLANRFVVPALALPDNLRKIEDELLTMPVFLALKEHDPATYGGIIEEFRNGLAQNKDRAELIAQIKPRIEQVVQKRVPVASDEAVVAYVSVMAREMRELLKKDPMLCFKFLFPQQYGSIDISKHVSGELLRQDLAALTGVIKSSSEQPQAIPELEDVAADLEVAVSQLQRLHQEDVVLLDKLGDASVDKAKACGVAADFYEIIIGLPADKNGKVLRYMLSSG